MDSRHSIISHQKIGFIGCGNMAQAMIRGLVEGKVIPAQQIYVTNRSPGKLQKCVETLGVNAAANNEALVDECHMVVIAVKPQDLTSAIEPIASSFRAEQIVISLAAGYSLDALEKLLPDSRLVRVMPNTPSFIQKGVLGYCMNEEDQGAETMIDDLLRPLGLVIKLTEGDEFDALTVSCASGPGFIFELMLYWQEWIEERGFDAEEARKMTVQTFLGAAMLAEKHSESSLEDLLAKVASKKGVTEAGLQSMRELELERGLRISFEKASLRNKELAKSR